MGRETQLSGERTVRWIWRFNRIPRWLEHSGLPRRLNRQCGQQAWSVFKQLVEFDWRFNLKEPGWFEYGAEAMAELLGTSSRTVRRCLKALRQAEVIEYQEGTYRGQRSRFRICLPLPVQRQPDQIPVEDGGMLGARAGKEGLPRYAQGGLCGSLADPSVPLSGPLVPLSVLGNVLEEERKRGTQESLQRHGKTRERMRYGVEDVLRGKEF